MVRPLVTLDIRLPKKLLEKADDLVKSSLFQNRNDIIRAALRSYINENNYNEIIPIIVPFTAKQIEIPNKVTFKSLISPERVIKEIKKEPKILKLA